MFTRCFHHNFASYKVFYKLLFCVSKFRLLIQSLVLCRWNLSACHFLWKQSDKDMSAVKQGRTGECIQKYCHVLRWFPSAALLGYSHTVALCLKEPNTNWGHHFCRSLLISFGKPCPLHNQPLVSQVVSKNLSGLLVSEHVSKDFSSNKSCFMLDPEAAIVFYFSNFVIRTL